MRAETKTSKTLHKSIGITLLSALYMIHAFMMLLRPLPVHASEEGSVERKQIIFALDGSYSMTGKRWQTAVDCIAMVEAMLPPDYETAVLVYNSEVVYHIEFGQMTESRLEEIRNLERKGYTNTGAAVAAALESFSAGALQEKRILIFSDGEISMKGQQETEAALLLYQDAVDSALTQDVRIDAFLFEDAEIESQITDAPAFTGGYLFQEGDSGMNRPAADTGDQSVGRFAEEYLFGQLGIGRVVLGASEAAGNTVEISLQDSCSEQVRILVTADTAIEDIQVSCQSEEVRIIRGEWFAVAELVRPREDAVTLQYTLTEPGRVNTYLTKEYDLAVEMEAAYVPELSGHEIRIRIRNTEGENLLEQEAINRKPEIYIDGSKADYTLEQGQAVILYPVESSREVSVKVDLGHLEGRVVCTGGEGSLYLELPPPPEPPEEEESYLWVYIVVTGVCIVFLVLLLLLHGTKKKTLLPTEPEPKEQGVIEAFRHDFSGKLVVYLLKAPGEADMPPASINLYRREGREPFSFQWVREKCHMELPLEDADKLQFFGGPDHTLCVRNHGKVTVMSGQEILLQNRKYTLHYGEKLLLVFDGGETELEIHYKNMKPSERER